MSTLNTSQLVEWVAAITDRGINLTSWEIDFIESMQMKIDKWGDDTRFSDNQAERIEQIYMDRVP